MLDQRKVVAAIRYKEGNVLATIEESPNEARLRWQREVSAKSFHSSIIGSAKNHSQVTAYDVAIGSGKASSDPQFYAYLCAVADWRVRITYENGKRRPGILLWSEFLENFRMYFDAENTWRKNVIKGNVSYYNSGVLPADLPVLTGPLWKIIISETKSDKKTSAARRPKT